jgi:hypothetical protein
MAVRTSRSAIASSALALRASGSSLATADGAVGRRAPLRDANVRANVVSRKKPAGVLPPPEALERLGDPHDPMDCFEFDIEVYQFMRSVECTGLPSANIFSQQSNITPRMRATVLDWLVEVHRKLRMHTDTLYLTVMLIDQYLASNDLDKAKFQRLACAALLIAGKNSEMRPPSLQDLVDLADKSFTVIALSRMEAALFAAVDFHVDAILPSMFLKRFLRLVNTDVRLSMLAHFICETALLDTEFIGETPSRMAASVVCLAVTLERGAGQWSGYLEANTGYKLEQIAELVQKLLQSVAASSTGRCQAIRKKYAGQSMCKVSAGPFPESILLA